VTLLSVSVWNSKIEMSGFSGGGGGGGEDDDEGGLKLRVPCFAPAFTMRRRRRRPSSPSLHRRRLRRQLSISCLPHTFRSRRQWRVRDDAHLFVIAPSFMRKRTLLTRVRPARKRKLWILHSKRSAVVGMS